MATKTGVTKRAYQYTLGLYRRWLGTPSDEGDTRAYFIRAFNAGYRYGRKVEREDQRVNGPRMDRYP